MTEHQNNKIRYIFAVAFIIFACLTGIKSIHPSEKAYKLSPEHAGGDLVISCEFEDQTFPLAFISPSGEEAEATCHESGKFATYIRVEFYSNVVMLNLWSKRHDAFEYSGSVLEAENKIREIAGTEGAIFFDLNVEGIALLFRGESEAKITEAIKRCVKKIEEFLNEYNNMRYFGGIGQCAGRITEIPDSFNWASRAYAHIYLTSDNGFLWGSEKELHPVNENLILSEIDPKHIDRRHIKEFLRRGDESETEVFLEEFFNGMGKNAIKSTMLRQYIAMDLYFCVSDFVESDLGVDRDKMDRAMAIPTPEILADEDRTREYLVETIKTAIGIRDNNYSGKYHDMVKDSLAYIDEHYSEDELSLNSLAAHVNFSPNHLSAVFKQETGQPFIKYLTDYRMEQAKRLLCTTSKKSNEIALLVGYKVTPCRNPAITARLLFLE